MNKRADKIRNLGKNVNEKPRSLLIEIRLDDVGVLGGASDPQEEIFFNLCIVNLKKAPAPVLDFNKVFERFMEFIGWSGKKEVLSIQEIARVHKILFQLLTRRRKLLDILLVTENRDNILPAG